MGGWGQGWGGEVRLGLLGCLERQPRLVAHLGVNLRAPRVHLVEADEGLVDGELPAEAAPQPFAPQKHKALRCSHLAEASKQSE